MEITSRLTLQFHINIFFLLSFALLFHILTTFVLTLLFSNSSYEIPSFVVGNIAYFTSTNYVVK